MNQGESLNWSSLGSGGNAQKVNGKVGNLDEGKEKVMDDQEPPNLSFNLPKRLDDPQEDVPKSDLPNGHNNSDTVDDEVPRTKSIGELLQEESDELEDTVLVDPAKDNPDDKQTPDGRADEASSSPDKGDDKSNGSPDMKHTDADSKGDKKSSKTIDESQDMFETSNEGAKSANDTESKEKEEPKEVEESQGGNSFKLEVSESQFFKDADSSQDSTKEDADENEKDKEAVELVEGDEEMKDEPEVQNKTPSSPGQSVKTDESTTEPSERPTVQSDNPESMQSIRTTPSVTESCNCDPSCHIRVHSIAERLSSACKQLGDFIKLKRRVENPDLTNLLSFLTSIESIADNKPLAMSSPLPDQVFYAEAASAKKKSISRARYETATPQKEPAEKKPRRMETPKIAVSEVKVNFQSIKGLAVFAKWPNSGWYYPGVIEGLSPSDWKEATNVTVTFYDGLVREMKNINILPANLIPPGVILCDLDDETEMLVNSSRSIEDNNVEFKLSLKDDPKTIVDSGFNKLAIKATHMKSIKQVLEPSVDVVPKKMHMVSLDNLVSGRRSRVRTTKGDADEITDTPRKGTRKSVRKAAETPAEDEVMDDEDPTQDTPTRKKIEPITEGKAVETPMEEEVLGDEDPTRATPSRKRSSSIDQSSTPKRSAKRVKH